jgi:hypothetical protein
MSNFFEERIFKFEDAPRRQPLAFSFKLANGVDPSVVHYVVAGCGTCTEAWFNPDTSAVEGTIDLEKAAGNVATSTMKTITVYLDPEVPEFVSNEKYQRITNPNKRKQALQLSGTIID